MRKIQRIEVEADYRDGDRVGQLAIVTRDKVNEIIDLINAEIDSRIDTVAADLAGEHSLADPSAPIKLEPEEKQP